MSSTRFARTTFERVQAQADAYGVNLEQAVLYLCRSCADDDPELLQETVLVLGADDPNIPIRLAQLDGIENTERLDLPLGRVNCSVNYVVQPTFLPLLITGALQQRQAVNRNPIRFVM